MLVDVCPVLCRPPQLWRLLSRVVLALSAGWRPGCKWELHYWLTSCTSCTQKQWQQTLKQRTGYQHHRHQELLHHLNLQLASALLPWLDKLLLAHALLLRQLSRSNLTFQSHHQHQDLQQAPVQLLLLQKKACLRKQHQNLLRLLELHH
jgi:hypothetical protein